MGKNNHIKWSVSAHNDKQYVLMTEYWIIESRGTDIPLNVNDVVSF